MKIYIKDKNKGEPTPIEVSFWSILKAYLCAAGATFGLFYGSIILLGFIL